MKTDEENKTAENVSESEVVLSELHEPVWAVVNFEKCMKDGLTYDEAVKELERLKAEKISGLCIITSDAAERI